MPNLSNRLTKLEASEQPSTVFVWVDANASPTKRKEAVSQHLQERGLLPDTAAIVVSWKAGTETNSEESQ